MFEPGMRIGLGELIVVIFVILVIFSASRMGTLGNSLGKFVYSLRKASRGQDFIDVKRMPDGSRPKGKPEDATVIEDEPK